MVESWLIQKITMEIIRMNKNNTRASIILACLFGLTLSQAASAAETGSMGNGPFFGQQAKGKWIIGAKVGKIENNVEALEDADATGIVLGYHFDRPVGRNGSSTIELEYISGDSTQPFNARLATNIFGAGPDNRIGLNAGNFADNVSFDVDVLNLFFTYRTAGDLYFKVKTGLSYSEIEYKTLGFRGVDEDVALALGLGLGYRIGDYGSVEVEYSADSSENDLGILGLNALLEF